jgi:hypothetical protein
MLERLGGRKFILSMTIVLLTAVLLWLIKIDQDTYKYIILSITGGYLTSNVAQKTIGVMNLDSQTSKLKE